MTGHDLTSYGIVGSIAYTNLNAFDAMARTKQTINALKEYF